MFSRTSIAVATGPNLVVKGAVDFILFGSEDRGKVVGHFETRVGKKVAVKCNKIFKFDFGIYFYAR